MGLKSTLFGKPPTQTPSSGESGNKAYDDISKAFSPGFGYFTGGGNMIGNLLGVNGGPAQTQGLENFANSGGMQFLRDEGMKGITSSKAAQGLLNSGSYGTALAKFNNGLASTYLDKYMSQLNDYSKLGLGAGSLVAQAGQYSKQTGASSKPGKQGLLPTLLSVGASAMTGGMAGGLGALGGGMAGGLGDILGTPVAGGATGVDPGLFGSLPGLGLG